MVESDYTVYVRYRDHGLFRRMFGHLDPEDTSPFTLECVGWLHSEDADFIRVVNERFVVGDPPNCACPPDKCLAILKSTILELRRLE